MAMDGWAESNGALKTKSTDSALSTKSTQKMPAEIRSFHDLAIDYPNMIADAYSQLKAGGRRFPALMPDQKAHYDGLLSAFSRRFQTWMTRVKERLDAGLFSPEYRTYYHKVLTVADRDVVPFLSTEEGLRRFHLLYNQFPPPSGKLPFLERYLKADYADDYRLSKVRFYDTLTRTLREQQRTLIADLTRSGDGMAKTQRQDLENKIQKLDAKIAEFTAKSQKWTQKVIMFEDRSAPSFALDDLMGISFLREMGLSGRGVSIAVLEASAPPNTAANKNVHQDVASNLDGASFYDFTDHGTHVTGILAAKARTVLDRLGIAHGAKIFYLNAPPFGDTVIERGSNGKGKNWIVDSHLSAKTDDQLASQIRRIDDLGIRLINASVVLSLGPKTREALDRFIARGGVVVKAAGNGGITLSVPLDVGPLNDVQQYQQSVDVGLYRYLSGHDPWAVGFLLVGNLEDGEKLAKTSNKAGFLKDRYVAAWGYNVPSTIGHQDRREMTGTSMAAPMVAGGLALLMEGFPGCTPQVLAQAILDGAYPQKPPETFGRGRLDLRVSYGLAKDRCPPPKNAFLAKKDGQMVS